jgi:hypothetical protein
VDVRIALTCSGLINKLDKICEVYAKPTPNNAKAEALYPVRNEMYEFLQRLNTEIDAFTKNHPLLADLQD